LFNRHTGCSFLEQQPEHYRCVFQHMTTSPNNSSDRMPLRGIGPLCRSATKHT
jgi:hypothetical protein